MIHVRPKDLRSCDRTDLEFRRISARDLDSRLLARAERVIPGGVSSPVRAFRGVGGDPVFVRSAEGAWLTAEDGRR